MIVVPYRIHQISSVAPPHPPDHVQIHQTLQRFPAKFISTPLKEDNPNRSYRYVVLKIYFLSTKLGFVLFCPTSLMSDNNDVIDQRARSISEVDRASDLKSTSCEFSPYRYHYFNS